MESRVRPEGSLASQMIAMVAIGTVLAVAYNFMGLRSEPAYGLPWIGAEEQLPQLGDLIAANGGSPVAPAPTPAALPPALAQIPDLERPIQVQLSKVQEFYEAGALLLVDARPAEEFARGHIDGAISMPYEDVLPEAVEALEPGNRAIVTYCDGGSCELSMNLAWDMIHAGHRKVLVFLGGLPEWAEAGLPVAGGETADSGDLPLSTDIDNPMAYFGTDEPAGHQQVEVPTIPEQEGPIEAGIDWIRLFVEADAALVIDAREPEEYAEGHIAGAISLPYDQALPDVLERLDSNGRPLIVYCGGGTCELSKDLAWDLFHAGHTRVLVYMGGFPEWEASGLAVERGGER